MAREIEWCIWNAGTVTNGVDYLTRSEISCNKVVGYGFNDCGHESVLVVDALR